MDINSKDPKEFDAVLGGEAPPPFTGAILGGIEGLYQRFASVLEQARLDALADALKYGNEGVDILVKALKDASLQVRVNAYKILKQSNQALEETSKGIRLNIGDKIYCVYLSSLSYGDDWYYLSDAIHHIDNEDEDYYDDEKESEQNLFYKPQLDDKDGYLHYITALKYNEKSITEEDLHPILSPHISKEEAEEVASNLHRKRLLQVYYEYGAIFEQNYYSKDQLNQWCEHNNLLIASKRNEEADKFQVRIYRTLQDNRNIEILNKFWEYTVSSRHLAFVHECMIDRKCYLRSNDNL